MHTTTNPLASPETLDALADAHARNGDDITARTFAAMAKAWRATERALADAQAENSALMLAMDRAHANALRLEDLAAATANVLASVRPPLRQAEPHPKAAA